MAAWPTNYGASDQWSAPYVYPPNPQPGLMPIYSPQPCYPAETGYLTRQFALPYQPTVCQPIAGGQQPTQTMSLPPTEGLKLYSYEDLEIATRNISNVSVEAGGCKIGEGGFGAVYRANIECTTVAVKKRKKSVQYVTDLNILKKSLPPTEGLKLYSYEDLEIATRNFSNVPVEAGGCKIGEGGFGTVYRADIGSTTVAVKKLKNPVQYATDLNILKNRYNHENLLQLLGYALKLHSSNWLTCCLVYEYMENGSLEDRLERKGNTQPIPWQTRLTIAYKTALGINYLHTFEEQPMVHRDIKSANILLDRQFVPKIGDFDLVRICSASGVDGTELIRGTRGYMPPEAYDYQVSPKWDTYSFGVVLLELLTALKPYDESRKVHNLVTHMQNCDILLKLDNQTDWKIAVAVELYRVANCCLTASKRDRPEISQVLEHLRKLSFQC